MKKRVLILGAGPMQAVAINAAHDRGWEVVAVDGNQNAPARPLADLFEPST
jgi:formate-dependent phosphoribosylglycinamide formyltransferase (GAR transformylase)